MNVTCLLFLGNLSFVLLRFLHVLSRPSSFSVRRFGTAREQVENFIAAQIPSLSLQPLALPSLRRRTLRQWRTQVRFEIPVEMPFALALELLMKMLQENLKIKKIYWGNLLLVYI